MSNESKTAATQDERAKFEAWADQFGFSVCRRITGDDEYIDDDAHAAWLAWQGRAALAAAPAPVAASGAQWVPVSERLPEPKQAVLVAKEFFCHGDWRIKVGGYAPDHPDSFGGWHIHGASWAPSHWMPLPAAPTDAQPKT